MSEKVKSDPEVAAEAAAKAVAKAVAKKTQVPGKRGIGA
jgi:hypothetical protein